MERNYSVDEPMMESVLDDAAQAPEVSAEALSAALGEVVPSAAEAEQQVDDQLEMPENKGLRGRMMQFEQRGYKRGAQEAESKWEAERKGYQEQIAKYEAEALEREAKRFAQEKNMPEDIALEYLKLKKASGVPPVAEQPRDDAGRFTAQPSEPEDSAALNAAQTRAMTLMAQADAFEKMSGGGVTRDAILDAFQNDTEIHQRVVSGEWDFTDVGQALSGGQQRAPRVSRSASNGRVTASTFSGMSDDEFAMFDAKLSQGAVFDARR